MILNLIGIHLDRGKLCHSQLYLENTTRRARNRESSIELVEWADPGLLGSIPLPLPPSDAVIMLQTRKVHFDFLSLSHIIFFSQMLPRPLSFSPEGRIFLLLGRPSPFLRLQLERGGGGGRGKGMLPQLSPGRKRNSPIPPSPSAPLFSAVWRSFL